jgi:hypothetical protein
MAKSVAVVSQIVVAPPELRGHASLRSSHQVFAKAFDGLGVAIDPINRELANGGNRYCQRATTSLE